MAMATGNASLSIVWRCPDSLWDEAIEPILRRLDPAAPTGRPRTDPRKALEGIVFQARTGCRWNDLPREFGDDSSVHRTLRRWIAKGLFAEIRSALLEQGYGLDEAAVLMEVIGATPGRRSAEAA